MFQNCPALVLNADFQTTQLFPTQPVRLGGCHQGGGEGIARRRGRV